MFLQFKYREGAPTPNTLFPSIDMVNPEGSSTSTTVKLIPGDYNVIATSILFSSLQLPVTYSPDYSSKIESNKAKICELIIDNLKSINPFIFINITKVFIF